MPIFDPKQTGQLGEQVRQLQEQLERVNQELERTTKERDEARSPIRPVVSFPTPGASAGNESKMVQIGSSQAPIWVDVSAVWLMEIASPGQSLDNEPATPDTKLGRLYLNRQWVMTDEPDRLRVVAKKILDARARG